MLISVRACTIAAKSGAPRHRTLSIAAPVASMMITVSAAGKNSAGAGPGGGRGAGGRAARHGGGVAAARLRQHEVSRVECGKDAGGGRRGGGSGGGEPFGGTR